VTGLGRDFSSAAGAFAFAVAGIVGLRNRRIARI
jgi:hypothetical protein